MIIFMHFILGALAIILSIGLVVLLSYYFIFHQEPDPTATEKLEEAINKIIVDTVVKGNQ
jgi:hypothetical protein